MDEFDRGSEWRKWDLHVHTPYTFLNGYTCEDDKFIEKIKNENISCIGLTNYFKFHDEEFNLKEKLEEEGITTFLNLEVRLDYQNKDDDCLDLHIIFSNTVGKEDIKKFLQNMNVNVGGNDRKCIDLTVKSDFENAVINFDKLKACLEEESIGLRGKYLIGFLSRGKGNARTSTNYEKLTKYADILIHSTDNSSNIKEDLKFWSSYKKPLLQNSDAHSLNSIGGKFTWIKADPTFEGLKTIIYEPEERVSIQNEMPESEKLDTLMIKEIRFESSDNKFTSDIIKLNKNLNVIIGGKSSGKSILLFEIAKTLYADVNHKILKYLDTEDQKLKDLYDLSIDDSIFNFHIKLYSGTAQSLNDRNQQSSILPSIKYIPQNHLSNLVDKSRMNGATLKKLIRDLILEDESYKKKYDEFVEQARKNDTKRNQDIDYYFSLKDEINKKRTEFSTRGDVKGLEEGIASSKSKIEQLNKKFSDEERVTYNSLIEKSSLLKIEEGKVNSDYQKIKDFNTDLNAVLTEYLSRKELMIESLEVEAIKNDFTEKYKSIENIIDKIELIKNEIIKDEEENFLSEGTFQMAILNIQNERNQVERDLKPFISKLENQKQVEAIQGNISEDEKKLSEIKQFQKEIDSLQHTLESQKDRIFTDFESNFKLYEKILYDLKPRITSIKDKDDKVEIIGSVKYHFPKIYKKLNDMRNNNNRFDNRSFKYLYPDNGFKSSLSTVDFDQILISLKSIFENIESEKIVLKNNYSIKDACKAILTDYFFDHWDVKSDNDDIHKMSTGKASFVLLKLIIKLSKDNGPILIDQPEDNLDNRSVSKELVEYLKINKRNRQIILVTHNPNIVVNADSENIIVANQKGQNDINSESPYQFDFINGSLENTFPNNGDKNLLKSMGIREHIADIVEGGMEAFRQRERKYSFKNIPK
ncbi:TrlF family AAA-like ATPase [Elizabethkingia anophelis]|uniref:TrlF family AAA-like ATPase n=1 Tax=Elizabethkingia anophelis TaxID=1117645 RepID=UPI00136E5426|nr:hypothetical protein [Elizabethkingia anophelis]MYY28992.1 hypothetical protein [Elizabethkingia anophelis]